MPKPIKLISWNVNGIRSVIRKELFVPYIQAEKPDIICFQETKAMKGQAEIDLPEYEEIWNSADKKGYSGTAIFTKIKPMSITFNFPKIRKDLLRDSFGDTQTEGRVITMEFDKFFVVTVYTPNSKRDLKRLKYRHKKWDPLFLAYIKSLEKLKPAIICGDFNVAHKEIDLARPKENHKNAGFTDEEREGCDKIVEAGFIDTFRFKHPNKEAVYTWWSNFSQARDRNIGWRIDYFFVSKKLKTKIKNAFIRQEVMGSDHCPVGLIIEV